MSLLLKPSGQKTGFPSTDIISIHTTTSDSAIGYPRASSLYQACIRKHALGTKYKIKQKQVVGFARNLTFDIGDSVHSLLQNSSAYFGEQRRGLWECLSCGHVRPFGRPPAECGSCGSKLLIYKELELVMDSPYQVSGHPDLFISPDDAPTKIRVVELKTMNGEKFVGLAAPLIEHVWQIQTYMWACSEMSFSVSTRIDPDYGYIVYISKKEIKSELPIKTFVVERDERVLGEIKDKLKLYRDFKTDGKLPPVDSACRESKFSSWKARTCPTLKFCRTLDKQD